MMNKRIELLFDLHLWNIPDHLRPEMTRIFLSAPSSASDKINADINVSDSPSYLPILIDDKSHVKSVVFSSSSSSESNNKNTTSASSNHWYSSLYSGSRTLDISRSDENHVIEEEKNLTNLNILLLHSILRIHRKINIDENGGTRNMDTVNMFLQQQQTNKKAAESVADDENNDAERTESELKFITELSENEETKITFVTENVSVLMNSLLPCIVSEKTHHHKDHNTIINNKRLTLDDLSDFFDNPELIDRLLFSYSIVLNVFGLRLHNFQDGTVDRLAPFWKKKYELYEKDENERIFFIQSMTRCIRVLLDFRLRRIAKKLVQFFLEEMCEGGGRLGFLRNVWQYVWVPMVLVTGAEAVDGNDDDGEMRWTFDSDQRQLWFKKLREYEEDSSDDDDE